MSLVPTSSSPSTARRLLSLLELLQSRRDWPAPLLAARLGVSERTVRRDVDRLRELDYAVEATRGPDGGYRLEAGSRLPPLLLDEEQALAVTVALRTAVSLGGELGEAAERALQTVDRLMPTRVAHRVQRLSVDAVPPAGATPVNPDVLLEIGAAVRDRRTLRFDYESTSGRSRQRLGARTTEPHHLLLSGGRWYVVGWSPEHDDWRVHRPDRMTLRPPHGRRFERRELPGGDPVAYLAGRFRGSDTGGTWPCWGEAVLETPAATLAPYVGDGTLQELDADHCRLRLGSWSWEALAARFLGLGVEVRSAEPDALVEAFSVQSRRSGAVATG